ncbi:hypothetical protein AAHB49_04095 [Bacillus cereus]
MQKWKLIYQVIIFLLLVGIGIVKYATPMEIGHRLQLASAYFSFYNR